MEKFLDAYIKLVTQFLTILAPLTAILLSEFNNRKKNAKEEIEIAKNEANAQLGNMGAEEGDKLDKAAQVVDNYKSRINNIKSALRVLSLRHHIPRLFISLAVSLTLVLISLFYIRQDKSDGQVLYLFPFWLLLCGSLLCFIAAICFTVHLYILIIRRNE